MHAAYLHVFFVICIATIMLYSDTFLFLFIKRLDFV